MNADLQFITPELMLLFFAIGSFLVGIFARNKKLLGVMVFFGVVLSWMLIPASLQVQGRFFFGMLVNDGFSTFFREVLLMIAGIVVLLSMGYKSLDEDDKGEYYFFILTVTISMMLAVASNNLMMIYIALESVSIISYILAGFMKRDLFSSEAGLKYFLFGAFSTGVTLYGISLLYGICGTLDLPVMAHVLSAGGPHAVAAIFCLLLVLVGFGFKCSLAPFHMWTPDVYQGAPTPVAGLLSVGPKAMGFAVLLRIFVQYFAGLPNWPEVASVIAIVTMTVGNIMALRQTNIKRLLAYSTIAQAGYIFIGLAVGTPVGVRSLLFYIFVYAIMNLGAFGAVIMTAGSLKNETIDDLSGLYKRDPLTAVILTISLLSLAGIPPLSGFLAKFFVLAAAVEMKMYTLAIFAALNSVVGVFYYLKVIKFMFLHEPTDTQISPKSPALHFALVLIVVANVLLGIWPHPVIDWISVILHP